jgi:hypothetical protein
MAVKIISFIIGKLCMDFNICRSQEMWNTIIIASILMISTARVASWQGPFPVSVCCLIF